MQTEDSALSYRKMEHILVINQHKSMGLFSVFTIQSKVIHTIHMVISHDSALFIS